MGNNATKSIQDEDDDIANRDYEDKDFRSSITPEDEPTLSLHPSSSSSATTSNTDSIVLLENGGVEIIVHETPSSSSSSSGATNSNSSESQRSKHKNNSSDDDDGDALASNAIDAGDEDAIGNYFVDEDEDVDADNGTNEDMQARERASMRQNYGSEDAEEYSQLIGTFGVEDDEFEDTALEFMQTYERNIYFMRRYQYPKSLLVIAHESTPLALYCRHIAVLQNQLHESVMQMNPATLPPDADDATIQRHIPGILAQVVREVLHEPAQFVVGLDDGTSSRVIENEGDPSFSHPDGISLPLSSAPLMVLEPTDVNYKEKLELAQSLQLSPSSVRSQTLDSIDKRDQKDLLRRFSHTGRRMPHGRQASPGFTEQSPVQDANDVWLIITLPYYLMWQSYERTCEGNGNLLIKLNSTLGALDDNSYFFPVKMEKDEVTYTARQEHEVLRCALESYMRTLRIESEIAMLHAQVKNFAEVACARLDDNFMKQLHKEVGKEASPKLSDLLQHLSETANVMKNLEERLKELDTRRGLRSFTVQ